jgi:hypothetical protein
MDSVKTEIGRLEKSLNTLVRRPRLIRREYWLSQIDGLLERPGLSMQDRRRLRDLLDLLVTPGEQCGVMAQP